MKKKIHLLHFKLIILAALCANEQAYKSLTFYLQTQIYNNVDTIVSI